MLSIIGCVYLAVYILGDWSILLYTCSIAPLFLLRNDKSVALGLKLFRKIEKSLIPKRNYVKLYTLTYSDNTKTFNAILIVLFVPLLIRLVATAVVLVRDFKYSIRAVPKNLFNHCFCIDSRKPIELLPGIDSIIKKEKKYLNYTSYMATISTTTDSIQFTIFFTLLGLTPLYAIYLSNLVLPTEGELLVDWSFTLFGYPINTNQTLLGIGLLWVGRCYQRIEERCIKRVEINRPFSPSELIIFVTVVSTLISFCYRYTVKTTAIVWLPLVWLAYKIEPRQTIEHRLRILSSDNFGRFIVLISVVVILAYVAKLAIYNEYVNVSFTSANIPTILNAYLQVDGIPMWQVAATFNALITIFLYFWSGRQLIHISEGALTKTQIDRRDNLVILITSIMTVVSVYTVSNLLLILLELSDALEIAHPPIGEEWHYLQNMLRH